MIFLVYSILNIISRTYTKKRWYKLKEIKYKDIQTLEEYKEYNRQKSREWYKRNKEKKDQYSKDYYYNRLKKAKEVAI